MTGHADDAVRPDGWRKQSLAQIIAQKVAETGVAEGVTKPRAMCAVKRVAAHIGLKATDLLLLDTLAAFSQAQDWEEGARAIVWPSSAFLMEQTGFSRSSLKRHTRRLADLGLIAFRDSPNGKRWGRRDAQGRIVEAYGFDLTPISARTEEFEALATHLSERRELRRRLRGEITCLRRTLRSTLTIARERGTPDAEIEPWEASLDQLLGELSHLRHDVEGLQGLFQRFHDLLQNVHNSLLPSDVCGSNTDPLGSNSDTTIQTTNEPQTVTSYTTAAERAVGDATPAPSQRKKNNETTLKPNLVLQSCPEFHQWLMTLGRMTQGWSAITERAGRLISMIGVSSRTWKRAKDELGAARATAALALVFDKTVSGKVKSPGGYLEGMLRKARMGQLHLERSLHGRLSQMTPA